MSPNDSVVCGALCGKNVTKTTGGVSCARCLKWFHIACVHITTEQLNFLQKAKGKFVFECDTCAGCISDISELRVEVRRSNESTQAKLDALLSKICNYDADIKTLKDDVVNCNLLIKQVDQNGCNMIKTLENKIEVMQKRSNKPNIILNGIPRKDVNLAEVVLSIFEFVGVKISFHELNICSYINNKKSVLVKFNTLSKRDAVMQKYYKKGKITENDILKNNSEKRIYLNEHLTEKGGKLSRLCRNLRNEGVIAKYRLLNSDLPRVKIHFNDNTEQIFDYEECFLHFCPTTLAESQFNMNTTASEHVPDFYPVDVFSSSSTRT